MTKFRTKADAISFAKTAFEADDILAFLKGEEDYSVPQSRYVSADTPTDFDYIIRVCIYGYYGESNDPAIPANFRNAILKMLDGDCTSIWCAYSICWFQSFHEVKGNAPFSIIDKDLVDSVRTALIARQAELEQCFLWQGKGRVKGLWEDIENSNAVLRDKYGRDFL